MKCVFIDHTERDERGKRRVRCTRCGLVLNPTASPLDRIHAECRAWPPIWQLGDVIALLLAAAGITKHRWLWLKFKLGMAAKCGCEERKEAINGWLPKLAAWLVSFRRETD